MAYVIPERWEQGEIPTAAKFNTWKDALDDIYANLGAAIYNVPVRKNTTPSNEKGYYLVHRLRYLHYRGSAEIVDPAGSNSAVTLSGTADTWSVYDLQSTAWLYLGKLYEVKDCDACYEDEVN
jgi:hypothetical protein